MWSHPGAQLLFMGAELAQRHEWSHDTSLDWHLLDAPSHAGVRDCLRELNRLEAALPALWRLDHRPEGFAWLEANDAEHSCYSFVRRGDTEAGDAPVVVVANLTPVPRYGYRVGVPSGGRWSVVLSTDDARWWGSGLEPLEGGTVEAEDADWHGQPASLRMALPPLSVVWLSQSTKA
jgi:1,4-alpha-glucan branching enzyme